MIHCEGPDPGPLPPDPDDPDPAPGRILIRILKKLWGIQER